MAAYSDREHFIPLRRSDLVNLLVGQLPAGEDSLFRRFCDLLCDRVHIEFYRLLDRLKDDYAPFDPDTDTTELHTVDVATRAARIDRLFLVFDRLLERANYRRMTDEEVLDCQFGASQWGLDMSIDLNVFERFALYVRGRKHGTRILRSWRTWFREKTTGVEIYQRLVIILKQRRHSRLGKDPDIRNVFLKLFKDIPTSDVEMLIPGARLMMPKMARGRLGFSIISGLIVICWQLLQPFFLFAQAAAGGAMAYGPLGIVAALFGYGYRQYYGYQFSLKSYNLKLAQSLYYQNLDNNSGVLYRLLDAAEEQECREAILAYFYLLKFAETDGLTESMIDDLVEEELERTAGIKVDFEIDDALRKLDRIGMCKCTDRRYTVASLESALEILASLPAEPVFAREVLDRDDRPLDIGSGTRDRHVRGAESVRVGAEPERPG
jgi:Protein of unknown function (DUF3754)